MAEKRQAGTLLVSTAIIMAIAAFGMGFSFGSLFSASRLTASVEPAQPVPVMQALQPGQPSAASAQEHGAAQSKETLRQAALASPTDARLWTRLGDFCYDSDDPDGAIEAYGRSLAIQPENPDVLTDMGTMYRLRGEPEKAVQCYDAALGYAPAHKNAVFNKGITMLADLHKVAETVTFWKAVESANPGFVFSNGKHLMAYMPEICTEVAGDLEHMGRLADALAACDEALKIDAHFAPALDRKSVV